MLTVAQTILSQINPDVLKSLNANSIGFDSLSLYFHCGPKFSKNMARVSIRLTAGDDYIIEAWQTKTVDGISRIEKTFKETGLYFDMLDDSLERLNEELWGVKC